LASAGQVLLTPSQLSAGSQTPPEARHTVESLASAGQVALAPVQASTASQSPAAPRQVVPFALNVQLVCSTIRGAVVDPLVALLAVGAAGVDDAVAAQVGDRHRDEVAVVRLGAAAGARIVGGAVGGVEVVGAEPHRRFVHVGLDEAGRRGERVLAPNEVDGVV
jgi:hypothetical protein